MEPHTPATPPPLAEVDRAVRRVRSENDIADDSGEPSSYRQSRRNVPHTSRGHRAARSSGSPPTPLLPTTAPTSPSLATPMATPSVQRPTRVFIRDTRGNMEVIDTFPEDLPAELERAGVRTRRTRPVPPGLWGKILVFLGQVGPDAQLRSKFMSFVWSASFGLVQVRTTSGPSYNFSGC